MVTRITPQEHGAPRLIVLGIFGRPHGIAGEVRLKSHTADPMAIARYGPLTASDGSRIVLTGVRSAAGDQHDLLVARVEGVRDRTAAERLTGLTLHVARDRLAEPEEDEFYLVDLVGLRAETPDGWSGRVVAIPDYGSGELLEIAPSIGGPTRLLPFTKAFVPEIDVAGGRIGIAPPDGWLDDAPAETR